jgi:hypothetical protein
MIDKPMLARKSSRCSSGHGVGQAPLSAEAFGSPLPFRTTAVWDFRQLMPLRARAEPQDLGAVVQSSTLNNKRQLINGKRGTKDRLCPCGLQSA